RRVVWGICENGRHCAFTGNTPHIAVSSPHACSISLAPRPSKRLETTLPSDDRLRARSQRLILSRRTLLVLSALLNDSPLFDYHCPLVRINGLPVLWHQRQRACQ